MRILYPLTIIYVGFAISSCTSPSNNMNCNNSCVSPPPTCLSQSASSHKNPLTVKFYSKNTLPKQPYTVIGEENISKFNTGGIKRQEANIRDAMRELAAAMGGDAVINIKHDASSFSGTVVAYEKNKMLLPQKG